MVDPIDNSDRASFLRKLKTGFVLLVGVSGALIALQANAGPEFVAGAFVGGGLTGVFLAWLALPSAEDLNTRDGRRSRRR